MRVHEFVNGNKPVMVFIHCVLCPWKIWTPQIEAFKEDYLKIADYMTDDSMKNVVAASCINGFRDDVEKLSDNTGHLLQR